MQGMIDEQVLHHQSSIRLVWCEFMHKQQYSQMNVMGMQSWLQWMHCNLILRPQTGQITRQSTISLQLTAVLSVAPTNNLVYLLKPCNTLRCGCNSACTVSFDRSQLQVTKHYHDHYNLCWSAPSVLWWVYILNCYILNALLNFYILHGLI